MRRNTAEIPVYIFCPHDFLEKQFYAEQLYFYVRQEGLEDILSVATVFRDTVGGTGTGILVN